MVRGGFEEGAEAWQSEVPFAKHEHFAGHQKKPAAGDRDHGVPDQADGGEGKIQFSKALPTAEAVNDGGFA